MPEARGEVQSTDKMRTIEFKELLEEEMDVDEKKDEAVEGARARVCVHRLWFRGRQRMGREDARKARSAS